MLSQVADVFAGAPCLFITIRYPEGKEKGISSVTKLCLKLSKTLIVVRERNKKTEGFHYHALVKNAVYPKKTWFKKGVHMNVKRVGIAETKIVYPPVVQISNKEWEKAVDHGLATKEEYEDHLIGIRLDKAVKLIKKMSHTMRVLHYMSKEMEMPAQYTDYMYVLKGKNTKLSGG